MRVRVTSGMNTARLSLTWRVVLSGVLLVHLAAVFVPPFTFATSAGPGMASPFAGLWMQALKPYIDAAFLDHGYFFFAPNPGPSHLLRVNVEFSDGRPNQELIFPDLKRQWPRLLYHRHFMLAEQLHADFVPSQPPPEITANPEQLGRWQAARKAYELKRQSFEEHLRAELGASRVTLTRIEHDLISPAEFVARRPDLNSAESFRDLSEDIPPLPIQPGGGGP